MLRILAVAGVLAAASPPAVSAQSSLRTEPVVRLADQAIRPGDVIKLTVWREAEYSGEFQVREGGVVVLPRIGDFDVTGETQATLRSKIAERFATYLREPVVDLVVLRRIKVLGAVQRPNLYGVDPTMTVGDVLALAGGPTPNGKKDLIEVHRDGERIDVQLAESLRVADSPLRSGDVIYIPEKSWLARNYGMLIGVGTTAVGLMLWATQIFSN